MFKLESYITPIILNHVDKYVKNFRPEDSQLSLWEGEVLFQNLDLRLDVLEEELNLPFEFLSGHIHELSIHIPWTKITSEPIRIIINTIEFVLKPKDGRADGSTSSASSTSPQRGQRNPTVPKIKKPNKAETEQTQQSAMMGLVNKIINNIVLQCHNIIFKYVAEDIVVSMNVQLLSFSAADDRWRPAMVDVHPVRVLMRNLVQISDLTICLDKRNAAGQIDVCQEPILYRCTLECRILRKHNINTLETTGIVRIGVYTKSLDINVSSLQFPMIMRVINLVMALKSKTAVEVELNEEELEEQESVKQSEQSYLMWAWNMLPSFNFQSLEEEEQAVAEQPGHTLDLGVYLEQFNFTLKSSEYINDSILGTVKRIRYTPIVRVNLSGIYFEFVSVQERNWCIIKAGVSSLKMEPLGPYRFETLPISIVETAPLENLRPFIDKSLFDEQYLIVHKGWGVANYEEYSTHITDEYLLYRTPVLAFDMVEYKVKSKVSSEETKPDDMRMQCRVLSSGIIFRYSQQLLQVKNVITELIDSYDYPAYYAEQVETTTPAAVGAGNASSATAGSSINTQKLHPPLMEDYDALMQYIPLRTFKILLRQINLEIHAMTEPNALLTVIPGQRPQRRVSYSSKQGLPCFLVNFEEIDAVWKTPLHPDKLVHTTCQLPKKPPQLLNSCYDDFDCYLRNFSMCLLKEAHNSIRLLHVPLLDVQFGNLLQPLLWKDEEVPERKFDVSCDLCTIEFSQRDLIACQRLVKCALNYDPHLLNMLAHQLLITQDEIEKNVRLRNEICGLRVTMRQYKLFVACNTVLHGLQSEVLQRRDHDDAKHILFRTSHKLDKNKKWLEWQMQLPNNPVEGPSEGSSVGSSKNTKTKSLGKKKEALGLGQSQTHRQTHVATTMALWIEKYYISVDSKLIDFLNYQEDVDPSMKTVDPSIEIELHAQTLHPVLSTTTTPVTPNQVASQTSITNVSYLPRQLARRSTRNSMASRKLSHPEETIHVSSERDEKVVVDAVRFSSPTKGQEQMAWLRYMKELVVLVQISYGDVQIADNIDRNPEGQIASDYTQIILPRIILRSPNAELIKRSDIEHKLMLPATVNLNWTILLQDLAIHNRYPSTFTADNILAPIQTSITIALTHTNEISGPPRRSKDYLKKLALKKAAGNKTSNVKAEEYEDEDIFTASNLDMPDRDNKSTDGASEDFKMFQLETESTYRKGDLKWRDVLTFNLHADTTPIRFYVSTKKITTFHQRLSLLLRAVQALQTTTQSNNHENSAVSEPTIKILTSAEEDPNIKEFLEMETNTQSSLSSEERTKATLVIALFCQWTITKIVVELKNSDLQNLPKSKLLLEFEDLLCTVDNREDFVKSTFKIGNFSLNYHTRNEKEEWIAEECLRIKTLGETSSLPFFHVIITCVGLKSFYQKIGIKRKGDLNRTISEILIKMQAIEIILDVDRLKEFVSPLCVFLCSTKSVESEQKPRKVEQRPLVAKDLPLIHLNSGGFVLYLPVRTKSAACSVLICKFESIKVTPNLENPLQRNPLRVDMFNKAAQMGIISTPGSMVEDRQYELTFENISASTGNWGSILARMREQANSYYNTNPAFEWNNQNQKPSLELEDIFSNFKFITIFAPCIVYNNILICGQATEFNCAVDFVASLNLEQLSFLIGLLASFQSISEVVQQKCEELHRIEKMLEQNIPNHLLKSQSLSVLLNSGVKTYLDKSGISVAYSSKIIQTICSNKKDSTSKDVLHSSSIFRSVDEDNEPDSGFQSCLSRSHCQQYVGSKEGFASLSGNSSSGVLDAAGIDYQKVKLSRYVPHTISLVAGVFSLKLLIQEYESSLALKPLVSMSISQPSFMFTQNVHDSTTQMSLFNLCIQMAGSAIGLTNSCIFPDKVLNTLPGELNSTGIPPPLFNLKAHCTKLQLLEMDVEVSRPLVITIEERNVLTLCQYVFLIYDAVLDHPTEEDKTQVPSPVPVPVPVPVTRGTKIALLKQRFGNADRIFFKCNRIVIKFLEDDIYYIKGVCSDIHVNAKFLTRPEKAAFKASIGALYLLTSRKIMLHPINLRASADLISEPWHNLPIVTATVKANVVQMDLGIYSVVCLQRALGGYNHIVSTLKQEHESFVQKHRGVQQELLYREQLEPIKCPSLQNVNGKGGSKTKLQQDEFYQDDLRAGAFQFVELVTDSFLPLPYQIQIIKKDFGIICWRYPQPRKMCKIHVYPVPMAVSNPIHIKCRMEYFSEAHESFLHYCDFWLSETVSKAISLPELQVCANIWRVVITQSLVSVNGECFENSEEDDELRTIASMNIEDTVYGTRSETEFILHPKVLVGCMRIDTAFQSQSVPKLQLLLSCNMVQIKLLNEPNDKLELPALIKKYRLVENTSMSQVFMEFVAERLNFHATFLTPHSFTLHNSLQCCIKCVDFGFMNKLYLLEQTTFQNFVHVNTAQRELVANFVFDRLRVNFGPAILHTLLSSKAHWEEQLDLSSERKKNAFITKCIVVNRTFSQVCFGQTGTTERIKLDPKECHMYSFRSEYHNQELTFFIADDETQIIEVSQSVHIPFKFEGEMKKQSIRIGNKCVIVKLQKISSTQLYILIKGQIELMSMVTQDLRLEFCNKDSCDVQNCCPAQSEKVAEYVMEKRGRGTFYRTVHRKSNIVMRIKLANSRVKGRSGDIPLRTNKNLPWLVKVPTVNNDFISVWVRVLREDITDVTTDDFQPQKVLITIWPIFVLLSMLATPISFVESTSDELYKMEPEGSWRVPDVPATHVTEHKVNFDFGFPLGKYSKKFYTLTLRNIDWNKFFSYDEQLWNCDYALNYLSKGIFAKWPLNDEEEQRVQRKCKHQFAVDVFYKTRPTRDFSCTLCLEISPWGIFINGAGVPVRVYEKETNNYLVVESNCLEMMFRINSFFTLGIPNGSSWINSMPIYLKTEAVETQERHYLLSNDLSLDLVLLRDFEVFKFVLRLICENERKIICLQPKFSVTNFTKRRLYLLPFTMDHKESASREEVYSLDAAMKKMDLNYVQSLDNCIGHTLNSFYDLHGRKVQHSYDTAFAYFVCIKISEKSDLSIPIPLTLPFARRCISIQNGEESTPLVLTLIEKGGLYYLNIFDDFSPTILVKNQTNVRFVIAQTNAAENSKVSNTTPEYDGRHFEWYQLLPANSKCYYTPPEMYSSFPDVESMKCNITIALYKDNISRKTIKWSKPLRIDKTWEKYLHVPNHGDVKINICDKHRVLRVSIYYIVQQSEFSVKDLRSRLLTPSNSSIETVYPESYCTKLPETASLLPLREAETTPAPPPCIHFLQECETKTQWRVRVFIKELMFSLHTNAKERTDLKCKIFDLHVDDLLLAFDDNDDRRQLDVLLPNLQVDNQLFSSGKYDFPVVLCAEELYARSIIMPPINSMENIYKFLRNSAPMVHLTLTFFEDEFKINSISCRVSPVRAYIEDAYLNDLLEALLECEPSNCVYRPPSDDDRVLLSAGKVLLPRAVVAEAICMAEPLQLRAFRIEPLSMLLSVHTSVRLYIALDHSPLSFAAYERRQLLTIPLRFGQSLGMHFLSGAIFGAGWVVGSLEILGSPSGLARSFSTGLRDFVSMPVRGLFRGPWGFLVGITQGSASLLRNVTAGTVNSVTKLASSVARNLDRLTLDQEHIERTEAQRRLRPQGFTEGLTQGVTGFGISILGAVGGIAHHTLEARTPVEVVTGVGKGLVGAVTKPLSGAAELVALAGQGMLHTVGFNAMPQQRAPSVCYKMAISPSSHRIWRLLPKELVSDQIVFFQEVKLVTREEPRRAYVFLTSAVFGIMESQWDKLALVMSVDRVKLTCDRDDKGLFHVQPLADTEDNEDRSYINERILRFLSTSASGKNVSGLTVDLLDDLLQTHADIQTSSPKISWSFRIDEHLGNHLMMYLNIIRQRIS